MNFIDGIAISNYRSFGLEPCKIGPFSKINIVIGKNNSGKSNILRFINNELPTIEKLFGNHRIQIDRKDEDVNLGQHPNNFIWGLAINLNSSEMIDRYEKNLKLRGVNPNIINSIKKFITIYKEVFDEYMWIYVDGINQTTPLKHLEYLKKYCLKFEGISLISIINALNLPSKQTRQEQIDEIFKEIVLTNTVFARSTIITDFRRINENSGSFVREMELSNISLFDGSNLIQQLAALEQPQQKDYEEKIELFNTIQDFVRKVTHSPNAKLTIPFTHDKILVDLEGNHKILPIEGLGTGIHEVIILAAACTILRNQIVCIEEPELHLHPLLQKDFINYIGEHTDNQYFISTHSAHLLNTPDVSIFHVALKDGETRVSNAYKISEKFSICKDLGYQPSDLFQTNSIIWVEGPSDRIYLNYWIKYFDPDLIEGLHYSIMFYGGKLLSHLTPSNDESIDDFILLSKLNQQLMIVMDSDRSPTRQGINSTKQRIKQEFVESPDLARVTKGREIENYLNPNILFDAVKECHPRKGVTKLEGHDQFECVTKFVKNDGELETYDKLRVALKYIEIEEQPDYSVLDLEKKIKTVTKFIRESNQLPLTD